ncbi:hypothetical protein ACLI1A_03550 [Flavobacterium sp. RHBU_3]|uniref:hypothetical protein n=1 Tax=Flavobacterium sp. RHBU_3 TaxID=3391184 RepID=UPI0039851140
MFSRFTMISARMCAKITSAVCGVLVLLVCSGCSVQETYFGANRKMSFSSKDDYLNFAEKSSGIPKEKFYLLGKDDVDMFRTDVIADKLSLYFGIVFEDNFVSGNQIEIKSCTGQIVNLYRKIPSQLDDVTVSKSDTVGVLSRLNVSKDKKTLVFIYSYKWGGFFKTKVSQVIKELSKDPDFDYVVVSMD